jgi:lipoate-protein ligase B
MKVLDLGVIPYRQAWAIQERIHEEVSAGGEEHLLLLEHTPVITFGRRTEDARRNLLASADALARIGVEVVESDRGGDITFHGPGQLVAYPIVRLNDHGLSVGAYVHRLEDAVISALREMSVEAGKDQCAVGVWVERGNVKPENMKHEECAMGKGAKICAIGVRVKRGVTLHGLALNVETDLRYFELINPCGLSRAVTSLREVLGDRALEIAKVKGIVSRSLIEALGARK